MICSEESVGQGDSTLQKTVTARHAYNLIPVTGQKFQVASFEGELKKGVHTFVPVFLQKSIHSLKGYQFGISYYKKWNWGYSHLGTFYSPDIIFPKFLLRSNAFFTLKKGFEVNLGYCNISYADGINLSILNLGTTYYHGSIMTSYNMKFPTSGFAFHRLLVRKSLKSDKDFIQLTLSRGQEQEELIINGGQSLNVYSFQFSLFKKIVSKTQVQLNLGITKSDSEVTKDQFFNYSIGLKREI